MFVKRVRRFNFDTSVLVGNKNIDKMLMSYIFIYIPYYWYISTSCENIIFIDVFFFQQIVQGEGFISLNPVDTTRRKLIIFESISIFECSLRNLKVMHDVFMSIL